MKRYLLHLRSVVDVGLLREASVALKNLAVSMLDWVVSNDWLVELLLRWSRGSLHILVHHVVVRCLLTLYG